MLTFECTFCEINNFSKELFCDYITLLFVCDFYQLLIQIGQINDSSVMACNSCAKPYTLFRKEKGCPGCGFSYCSKCLDNKIFLKKLNSEAKVCSKCKHRGDSTDEKKNIPPPDAFYKRIGVLNNETKGISVNNVSKSSGSVEQEIEKRLQQLKGDKSMNKTSDEEIMMKLQKIRGNQPTPSDAELRLRLAKIKDSPVFVNENKPLCVPDKRTEQEEADDLMKNILEQTNIDKQYKEGFDKQLEAIEKRILSLKGASGETSSTIPNKPVNTNDRLDSEDEENEINGILEKVKAESILSDEDISTDKNDELPFCEICNEDARMRCLGCRYLFCKRCFIEHKDDEDGCNRYEPYDPQSKN